MATIAPGMRTGNTSANDDDGDRAGGEQGGLNARSVWKSLRQRFHALPENARELFPSFNPKKSFTCVLAIRMAMPLVNPMTMGRGINFTAEPMPVRPMITRMTPAITVHMNKPSTPWSGDDSRDNDDKGPGRAADLRCSIRPAAKSESR